MSVSAMDIIVNKTGKSRISQLDPNNIQFGKLYSDHMLVAHYENGAWQQAEIMPYGNISLNPATTFIHYGQSIFEGVKAYRNADGEITIFRPTDNWKRMNRSAHRMGMPDVPEEIFIEGMRQLVELDRAWVPDGDGTSLYIRPFLFAVDEFIGVKPAEKFTFMIITSPAGPYYARPVSIYVHDKYVRAFPGGTGYAKAAGNYAATMLPVMEVRQMGYDQILWMDGIEHKYVQEIGTMNVFFVIGDKVITPNLTDSILDGITRDSIITLLRDNGYTVEERPLSIDEILAASHAGTLKEAFGSGTAASVSHIASMTYKDTKIELPAEGNWSVSEWVKKELDSIKYGRKEDVYNWNMKY